MKVLAILFSVLVAAQALPAAPGARSCQLQSDLQQLTALIDTEAIAQVLYNYLDDPDVQNVFTFVFSDEFRDLYLTVAGQEEVVTFLLWLEDQCVDVRSYIDRLRDYLELPPVPWRAVQRNGITNFWDDLLAVVPLAEIRQRGEELYQESADFAVFIDRLRSEEAEALYRQLAENETFQNAVQRLEANGINISAIREIIGSILGW